MVQNSDVMPHCPQTSQHAMSGHAFNEPKVKAHDLLVVWCQELASRRRHLGSGLGMEAFLYSNKVLENPANYCSPSSQVLSLKDSISLIMMLFSDASLA